VRSAKTPVERGTACVRADGLLHGLHPTQYTEARFDTRLAFRRTVVAEYAGSVIAGRDGAVLAMAWASPPALNASRVPG